MLTLQKSSLRALGVDIPFVAVGGFISRDSTGFLHPISFEVPPFKERSVDMAFIQPSVYKKIAIRCVVCACALSCVSCCFVCFACWVVKEEPQTCRGEKDVTDVQRRLQTYKGRR